MRKSNPNNNYNPEGSCSENMWGSWRKRRIKCETPPSPKKDNGKIRSKGSGGSNRNKNRRNGELIRNW
jgi:hypothetical protein